MLTQGASGVRASSQDRCNVVKTTNATDESSSGIHNSLHLAHDMCHEQDAESCSSQLCWR